MTYVYQCQGCNHKFEIQQSIKDESRAQCPSCQTITTTRLITGGAGFLLAGGKWAADGYGLNLERERKEKNLL